MRCLIAVLIPKLRKTKKDQEEANMSDTFLVFIAQHLQKLFFSLNVLLLFAFHNSFLEPLCISGSLLSRMSA